MEERLKEQFDRIIVILECSIKEAEYANLTNEQWFLNFLDELNELSVKH